MGKKAKVKTRTLTGNVNSPNIYLKLVKTNDNCIRHMNSKQS